jgi:Bacterial regulatory proteins, luxR family
MDDLRIHAESAEYHWTLVGTNTGPAGTGKTVRISGFEELGLMAQGRSNTAIARELVLTVGAVEKHVASILTKLRLPPLESDHRRVLAVLAYLQQDHD